MNRLVIIGNGFDLAHGLATSYNSFMLYLLNQILKKDEVGRFDIIGIESRNNRNVFHLKDNKGISKWICAAINDKGKPYLISNPDITSYYFNSLFEKYNELNTWSDLEGHYFEILNSYMFDSDVINIINEEFDYIKYKLENYLITNVEDKMGDPDINHKIHNSIFNYEHKYKGYISSNYFVSFNYTSKLLNQYYKWNKNKSPDNNYGTEPIYIHGKLIDKSNPIVFGYGDDNSDDYMKLKNWKSNNLLTNFKTFQYLRTINYKAVLGLLKEPIFVQVYGHSLGLSDKTLLKTIFQHPNTVHIEVKYYENESRYFENMYNLSRIIDDNEMMRSKVLSLEDVSPP